MRDRISLAELKRTFPLAVAGGNRIGLTSAQQPSMGNLSAVFFVALSFAIPLVSKTIRTNRVLLYLVWLTLAFRHGLALINAFVTPLSSSWGDLYRFHNIGAGISSEEGQPYGQLLWLLYRIFGASFWLGEVFSIVAYSLTLLVFVDLARQIGVEQRLGPAVLLFGLMPSPAVHCSVTLRESYQVLGFLGVTNAFLKIREGTLGVWSWSQLLACAVLLVFMHNGLALFAVGVMVFGIPWALQARGAISGLLGFGFLLAVPLLLPLVWSKLQDDSATIRALNEGRLLDYAVNYRNYVNEARSDYGVKIDTEDVASFVLTSSAVVVLYFVAPLPWQASSVIDYYAFFEVCVRTMLLFGCLYQLRTGNKEDRRRRLLLFALAVAIELMWSVGTTNWGTSLRHHVVAYGIFVLLGTPNLAGFHFDPDMAGLLSRRRRRKLVTIDG